jgi:hypothetical protein
MALTKTTSILPLFVVLAVLPASCGRTDQDPNVDVEKRELEELSGIYRMHVKNHQRPPAGLDDLTQYERIHPRALQLVREGKYIVVWGVQNKDGGTVIAYEKDAPTNGGWAVMADGTVKRLNADAFQSVPKQQQ